MDNFMEGMRQVASLESGDKSHALQSKWPHAPCHMYNDSGTYMVTGSTLHKEHLFRSSNELDLLQRVLLELANQYEWRLEAWAIFSNHYHFIANSPKDPTSLRKFITHLHATSARELNKIQHQQGRKVWHQYWDTQLTFEKSYLARLNYVMQNPVKHGLVEHAVDYDWRSIRWFNENTSSSRRLTVASFKTNQVHVADDY